MRFSYLLFFHFLLWFPTKVFAQNKHSKIYIHKLTTESNLNSGLVNRFRNGIIKSILRNFEGKYTIVDDDSLSILLKQVETLQKMDCSDEICM